MGPPRYPPHENGRAVVAGSAHRSLTAVPERHMLAAPALNGTPGVRRCGRRSGCSSSSLLERRDVAGFYNPHGPPELRFVPWSVHVWEATPTGGRCAWWSLFSSSPSWLRVAEPPMPLLPPVPSQLLPLRTPLLRQRLTPRRRPPQCQPPHLRPHPPPPPELPAGAEIRSRTCTTPTACRSEKHA
jgi:hypothetical protein